MHTTCTSCAHTHTRNASCRLCESFFFLSRVHTSFDARFRHQSVTQCTVFLSCGGTWMAAIGSCWGPCAGVIGEAALLARVNMV
jgi:hypothetical protein